MDDKHNETASNKKQLLEKRNESNSFTKKIVKLNAVACGFGNEIKFNIEELEQESKQGLQALAASGGLQEMLAAQMLSIHQLQQSSIAMASKAMNPNNKRYFTNSAIKLANAFTQQANLLSKLQGHYEQKIIVERVDVHDGGQAVVGNINGGGGLKK